MRNFKCESCNCTIESGKDTKISIYQGRICEKCHKDHYEECFHCNLNALKRDLIKGHSIKDGVTDTSKDVKICLVCARGMNAVQNNVAKSNAKNNKTA